MRHWFPVVALLICLASPSASAVESDDLLALVAMPLAVAAVSEVADVPVSELMEVVTLLNDARVPPSQFIEIVRYVPVALVAEAEGPAFVDYLRAREAEGLRGVALTNAIEERFEAYDLRGLDLDPARPRAIDAVASEAFIPSLVRTRVAARSTHPHEGPPGQLKKERGLQTGAEIVHGVRSRSTGITPPESRKREEKKDENSVRNRGRVKSHEGRTSTRSDRTERREPEVRAEPRKNSNESRDRPEAERGKGKGAAKEGKRKGKEQ